MNIRLDNDQERRLRITLQKPLIDADKIMRFIDMQIESGIYPDDVVDAYQRVRTEIQNSVDHSELLRLMLLGEE